MNEIERLCDIEDRHEQVVADMATSEGDLRSALRDAARALEVGVTTRRSRRRAGWPVRNPTGRSRIRRTKRRPSEASVPKARLLAVAMVRRDLGGCPVTWLGAA